MLANAGIFTVRPHAVLYCIFLAALSASCISDRTENAPITIPKMDRRIQEIVTQGNLPSVQIAVIERNKVAWSKAIGQNTGTDFVYMNGSVQKVFDATDIVFFPPWICLGFLGCRHPGENVYETRRNSEGAPMSAATNDAGIEPWN